MITATGAEVSAEQTPLVTITRYKVVSGRFSHVCVPMVLAKLVQVAPASVDDSQSVIVPVYPETVSVPLLLLSHPGVDPLIIPALETGFTVMVSGVEFIGLQIPLCTTARYIVVTARLL